jgi:Tol biopolymer transport system component
MFGLSAGLSADGRFVAFMSEASNLVPGDTNGQSDIFVRDRQTSTTRRVSVGRGGIQGNGPSYNAAISDDGRIVVFISEATNLVPGDSNGRPDVFVHERRTATTQRVSVGRGGAQADADSYGDSALSAHGRYVAFQAHAANLVPGDTNGASDVFVRNRRAGTTQRVSLGSSGVQSDRDSFLWGLSNDGRFVGFLSEAGNLVPGDTNGVFDAFVRDRHLSTTQRVSLGPRGVQGNGESYGPILSASGRFAVFQSTATNLVPGDTNGHGDVFVHDRRKRTTSRVSVGQRGIQADGASFTFAISADGRMVAFASDATNLVAGDTNGRTDVFVRDRRTGTTKRVSVGPNGVQGDERSYGPALSADGRVVAFQSEATNLVAGDTNGAADVFVRSSTTIIATARYRGHTYHLLGIDGAVWWDEAEAEARRLGGHLVTVNDAAENRFLLERFGPVAEGYANAHDLPDRHAISLWIGLTDQGREGRWTWVSGEPVGYTNWNPGQPEGTYPDEDFGGMLVNFLGTPGRWHDVVGDTRLTDLPFGVVEIPGTGARFEPP